MKQYIITVIGAAVLCAAAHLLTPSGWVKYVKIITGLVILSAITAPLASLKGIDLFSDFSVKNSDINENIQIDVISSELSKRIEQDIAERIKNEFFCDAEAQVKITVNENNEITGVTHIKITTDADKKSVTARMCEIYGINADEVEVYEP